MPDRWHAVLLLSATKKLCVYFSSWRLILNKVKAIAQKIVTADKNVEEMQVAEAG
jgi:hypothetical protein